MSVHGTQSHEGTFVSANAQHSGARHQRTVRLEVPIARLGHLGSLLPADLKRLSPEISAALGVEAARSQGERHARTPGGANNIFPNGHTVRLMPVSDPGGNQGWGGKRLGRIDAPSPVPWGAIVLSVMGVVALIVVLVFAP